MTVYFAQEPSPNRNQPDLSTAERFGEIVFVFGYKFPVSQDPERAYAHAVEVLKDFNADVDYVGDCGGDKMSLGVVTHILSDWDRINFLRWSRYNGGMYEPSYIGTLDESLLST